MRIFPPLHLSETDSVDFPVPLHDHLKPEQQAFYEQRLRFSGEAVQNNKCEVFTFINIFVPNYSVNTKDFPENKRPTCFNSQIF